MSYVKLSVLVAVVVSTAAVSAGAVRGRWVSRVHAAAVAAAPQRTVEDVVADLHRGAVQAEKNAGIFRDIPTARSYFLGQRDAYLDAAKRVMALQDGGAR